MVEQVCYFLVVAIHWLTDMMLSGGYFPMNQLHPQYNPLKAVCWIAFDRGVQRKWQKYQIDCINGIWQIISTIYEYSRMYICYSILNLSFCNIKSIMVISNETTVVRLFAINQSLLSYLSELLA